MYDGKRMAVVFRATVTPMSCAGGGPPRRTGDYFYVLRVELDQPGHDLAGQTTLIFQEESLQGRRMSTIGTDVTCAWISHVDDAARRETKRRSSEGRTAAYCVGMTMTSQLHRRPSPVRFSQSNGPYRRSLWYAFPDQRTTPDSWNWLVDKGDHFGGPRGPRAVRIVGPDGDPNSSRGAFERMDAGEQLPRDVSKKNQPMSLSSDASTICAPEPPFRH